MELSNWWAILFKLMISKSSVGSLVQSEALGDLVGPAR